MCHPSRDFEGRDILWRKGTEAPVPPIIAGYTGQKYKGFTFGEPRAFQSTMGSFESLNEASEPDNGRGLSVVGCLRQDLVCSRISINEFVIKSSITSRGGVFPLIHNEKP